MMIGFARNAFQPEVSESHFFFKLTSPRLRRPAVIGRVCCSRSKNLFASQPKITKRICKRCKKEYIAEENHKKACQYHSLNWSGGEIAKAHGFLRESEDLADQLRYKLGTGLISFWDCCGKESYDSPGCTYGRHVAYGEEDQ